MLLPIPLPAQDYFNSIPGSPPIPPDMNPVASIQNLLGDGVRQRQTARDYVFEYHTSDLAAMNAHYLLTLRQHLVQVLSASRSQRKDGYQDRSLALHAQSLGRHGSGQSKIFLPLPPTPSYSKINLKGFTGSSSRIGSDGGKRTWSERYAWRGMSASHSRIRAIQGEGGDEGEGGRRMDGRSITPGSSVGAGLDGGESRAQGLGFKSSGMHRGKMSRMGFEAISQQQEEGEREAGSERGGGGRVENTEGRGVDRPAECAGKGEGEGAGEREVEGNNEGEGDEAQWEDGAEFSPVRDVSDVMLQLDEEASKQPRPSIESVVSISNPFTNKHVHVPSPERIASYLTHLQQVQSGIGERPGNPCLG